MKKKNKIIAIVLSIVLGVGALISTISLVFNNANKIVGTQAAKILLARENMNDADTSFDWQNMFKDTEQQNLIQKAKPANFSHTLTINRVSPMNYFTSAPNSDTGELVHDSPAGKVYIKNGEYNFQNISGASYQGLVVESRLRNIDFRVENAAKNINYLKNELNIVNKWVKDGFSKFYLNVTSNKETLIEYYEDNIGQKSLWVVERETREDANSVYSLMYTDMQTEKINNPTYLVYIPNERYEYYYGHEGNATDYLIAENDKGYWNVFMPEENDYENLLISDDFAFQSSGDFTTNGNGSGVVSTVDLRENIIAYGPTGLTLYLSAFNGINGIYASAENCVSNTYVDNDSGEEKSYIEVNHLDKNKIKIGLNNGGFISYGDEFVYDEGTIQISGIHQDFYSNPGFADPQYSFSISLDVGDGLSLNEKLNLLETFLSNNGLTCKYNLNDIEKNIVKNSEIANSITSFYTWNGYLMNSSENFKNAESVTFEKINTLFAEYERVKDAEEVKKPLLRVSKRQTFGKISNPTIDGATYSEGKIQINNVSVTVEKSNLLEDGKKYKLQIGLARMDKDGKFLSQNTVNLKTNDSIVSEVYTGKPLTLFASGIYELPTALEESRYVVVAYVVTDDEHIRVSEMKSIGFVDTVNDTIETPAVKINIKSDDNNLIVEYNTKLFFDIVVNGELNYTTLRRKMMAEVLKHGYPMDNEEITDANGDLITNQTIVSGEYKLKFAISTIDGVVTGYVVCTVSE